jgi:hypothetical protein
VLALKGMFTCVPIHVVSSMAVFTDSLFILCQLEVGTVCSFCVGFGCCQFFLGGGNDFEVIKHHNGHGIEKKEATNK